MKKILIIAVFAAFCVGIGGCARTKKLLWWDRNKEESPAFVDEKNPLAVPPEYDVRPYAAEKIEENNSTED